LSRKLIRDWCTEYSNWIAETSESPEIWHLWSAATVISGAVKRAVWINRGDWKLHANMFTVLTGHTGLGKGRAINPAVGLLREADISNIMSDKLTIQYILEKLSDRGSLQAQLSNDATCFIAAPEIEDLLNASDAMPTLKELWEAKPGKFQYGTRGKGLVTIADPCPSILGGCTPSQIAHLFPTRAVGGGFVRRVNFVYASERSASIPWPTERNGNDTHRQALVADLRTIAQLRGQFTVDQLAKGLFTCYYTETGCDEFADEATSSYETSRFFHAMKLAMCLSMARDDSLVITAPDAAKAIDMVNNVCEGLKRVFRAVGDAETAAALDKILRFLEARTKIKFVTRSDIMNALWRDVGTTQNLDILLATLTCGNLIRTEQRAGITAYTVVKKEK
jgi:hypothetical protein